MPNFLQRRLAVRSQQGDESRLLQHEARPFSQLPQLDNQMVYGRASVNPA